MHGFLGSANQAYRDFPTDSVLNLIFASDDKFLPYTAVTLASVLTNLKDPRPVSVYLLTDGSIPPEHRVRFEALRAIRNFSLEEVIVDAGRFADIRTTSGISAATYYRLKMHELLPPHVHRGLYLDSDLTVRKCIGEIYDTDLQGIMFAGVEDSISTQYKAKFNLPPEAPHINAGVALVNLDEMRRSGFSQLVDDYIERHRYLITLGDQQIINCACYHKIKYLPLEWNVHGSMFDPKWRQTNDVSRNGHSHDVLMRSVNDPAIVHFTLKRRKPWEALAHPRAREWLSYARNTLYAETIDAQLQCKGTDGPSRERPHRPRTGWMWRVLGWINSLVELRNTRVQVHNLRKLSKSEGTPAGPILESLSCALLTDISGAAQRSYSFVADKHVRLLRENALLLTNQHMRDFEGGWHENLKTALRTSRITRDADISEVDAVLMVVTRPKDEPYWRCLSHAARFGKEVIFAETALFGGFANYFDKSATALQRRGFGFILDDMGFYFDARIPSRLETLLNSDAAILATEERERARRLIQRVIKEQITKYNAYAGKPNIFAFPRDFVLVVDQKVGDASIEYGGATQKTFDLMFEAAIRENPGRPVCFKVHPDNRDRAGGKFASRPADVTILPDDIDITAALDACGKVYTVTSQVGFEALLRGKQVEVFGQPFYAGWGLTNDRQKMRRRTRKVALEELFHAACIRHSIYVDPRQGEVVPIEQAFDLISDMRSASAPSQITKIGTAA